MVKKRFCALFASALLLACLLAPFPVAAEEAEAGAPADTQIPAEGYSVTLADGTPAYSLTDANRASSLNFAEGNVLNIESETPFTGVYLVWDTPPGAYELAPEGGAAIPCGQYGYLHDYTPLAAPATKLELRFLAGNYKLCDVYLFTEGTLPGWVQVWSPPLEKADMLVLPTHADDEHLFFGGTLPLYAGERGMNVQVVYLTNHFGEPYRPHELLNGLWTVGVRAYPVMGPFPDVYATLASVEAAEAEFGYDNVLDFQVQMIRRFKPEVIVAHDLNGEYGHGAHILNARTLLAALEVSNDASVSPDSAAEYGVWDVPKTYLHLYPEGQMTVDWNIPLAKFGGRTALDMAKEGFACHVSQQDYFSVEDFGPYDCRVFGLARSTVGPDVKQNDFFENIDLTPEPPAPAEPPAATVQESDSVQPPPSTTPAPVDSVKDGGGMAPWLFVVAGSAVAAGLLTWVVLLLRRGKRRKAKKRR